MEKPERGTIDDAQRAKLIFISVAAVVTILLIFSFVSGNKARTQRDAALKEAAALKGENVKLSQYLEQRTQEMEQYKKAYEDCKTKLRYAAPAKKTTAKKPATKSTKKNTTRK
jgi:cell division protein FtsB